MDKKTDILIIGAGPAGIISAVTALKYYPEKKITIIKNIEKGVVPCGIPYMVSSLESCEDNKMGTGPLEEKGVEVCMGEAISIDRDNKFVTTKDGKKYCYEKLILANGASPIKPKIPGIEKKGIYSAIKDMDYLKRSIEEIKKGKNVLVIGGGFIGVEFADELSRIEKLNVYLVEMLPYVLANSFDREFSEQVQQKLVDRGINILTGRCVVEFIGKERVECVQFKDGETLQIDNVILGIGAVPATELAKNANLDLGKRNGIWVDEYMRTVDPDIFAVGDCAVKRDFYTRKEVPVMLASTATAEARIAGSNLYSLKVVRENKGTIAVYSTYVDGLVLGSAGLTENSAKKEGFEIVVGRAEGVDKHPGALPGTSKVQLKLIFSKQSGIIMGGQISGGMSVGEMINIIGLAIQQRVSVTELETLQMATHPYLTAAPTKYAIVLAAQDAACKIKKG